MKKEKKFKLGPIQRSWIRALRSGKYKQGRNSLAYITETGSTFCCLGVACELAVKAGIGVRVRDKNFYRAYNRDTAVLPPVVRKWLGAKDDVCHFEMDGSRTSLASQNDNLNSSFSKVAAIIEKYPERIFKESR